MFNFKIGNNREDLWKALFLITIFLNMFYVMFLYNCAPLSAICYSWYAPFFGAACSLWVLFNFDYKKYKDMLFIILFGIIAIAVCVINKYNPSPSLFRYSFQILACFGIPFLLTEKQRKYFLNIIIYTYTAIHFYLGIIGLLIVNNFLNDTGYEYAGKHLIYIVHSNRIFVNSHPNTTAAAFSVALLFAIWIFFSNKNIFIKIISVLSMINFYLIILYTDSRTVQAAVIASIIYLVIVAFYKLLKLNHFKTKYIITIFTILLVLGSIFSYIGFNKFIKKEVETPNNEIVQQEGDKLEMSNRDYSDFWTFNGRTYIWGYTLDFIKNVPQILIKGCTPTMDAIMEGATTYGEIKDDRVVSHFDHIHSDYLFILVSYGIAGSLIIILFLLKMFFNYFRLVIKSNNKVPLHVDILMSVVVMALLAGTIDIVVINTIELMILPVISLILGYITYYSVNTKIDNN